jgi:hypothetical protein
LTPFLLHLQLHWQSMPRFRCCWTQLEFQSSNFWREQGIERQDCCSLLPVKTFKYLSWCRCEWHQPTIRGGAHVEIQRIYIAFIPKKILGYHLWATNLK